jgi:hypothetical protein
MAPTLSFLCAFGVRRAAARTHITGTEYAAKHRKRIGKKVLSHLRVVLIKHKLVLPDDGPCGPKHDGGILMYS